jgi:hypothetical protein
MAGNVRVVLKSVFDDKGIRDAQSEFAKAGKTIGGVFAAVGAAAAVAGAGIAKFGASSVSAASTLEESLNAVKVAYGDASGSIIKLGEDAAQRLGVTQSAFNAAAVRFSAFAERIVGDGGDVNGFLNDITTRAADFASVFNIDVSEALQVFQSGLSGEAEPLKRFGINLLDSEVKAYALRTGLIAVGETMTEQEKVQARYGLLMEATAKTAGDFANTSDSLANSQRILQASFEDLQAEVGTALLPVFADATKEFANMIGPLRDALVPAAEALATAFRTKAVPAIQDFTQWLASPEGTQRVMDFTDAIVGGIEKLIEFTAEVLDNWEEIKNQIVTVTTIAVALGALRTALQLATAAQLLFNVAVKANPYVIAATAIAALIGGLIALDVALLGAGDTQRKADEAAKGFTGRIGELVAEERRLQELLGKGAIGFAQYEEMVDKVRGELAMLQGQMMRAAGAGNALNNVSLAKFRGQLGDTRIDAEKLVEAQRELAYYMAGGKAGTYKPAGVTGGGGGGGGAKTDPAVEAKKRFDAVQKVIQEHQKKLASAEKSYLAEVFQLNEESAKAQKALREKEVKDLEAIVNQSKRRLTDAFASATQTALTSLFNSKTVKELTQSVRRVSASLTLTTTQETERIISGSVGDVIEGLRKKILGARTLIQNASKLAGLGFSQTFIEQVVEGGTETGNELAKAILEASPETQAELRRLFVELEDVSSNGMQSVADRIYEEQKLATAELAKLYTDTQAAASLALEEEQKRLASALVGAGLAFNLAVLEIKDEFLSAIEEFDGAFAGLGQTIKDFLAKLDVKAAGAVTDVRAAMTGPGGILEKATVTENVAFKDLAPLKAVSGLVIDSVNDIAGAISYLQERIAAGNRYITNVGANTALGMDARGRVTGFEAELAALRGRAAAGSAAGTTININVKTDSTQSQAMVGKTIGSIVTKYVTTGGQVLVSGSN